MIKIGLLWHDSSKRSIEEKLGPAIERYEARFGVRPNVCYLHPETRLDVEEVAGLALFSSCRLLLNHFWLAFDSEAEAA